MLKKENRWTWFVLLVIFVTGTFLLIITPMGANYDEETHIARVWEMSLGHIIPNSLYHETDFFPRVFFDSSFRRFVNFPVIDLETWKEQASLQIDFNDYMKYTTRGVYFPTIYAVAAVVMGITARLFDLPILYVYYAIRLSYLLIYCLFVYLTLRVLPTGRHLFGVIAMAPVAIIQSAAISADAFVFGVSFLFTGWVLHLLAIPEKTLSRRQLVITLLVILAVGTLKPNAIFLLLLLFILPRSLHLTKTQKWALFVTALISVAISASWSFVAAQFFLARDDAGKDPIGQFLSILKDPAGFVQMFAFSIKAGWWRLMMQSIGIAGYGYWVLPKFIYLLYPAVLVLAIAADDSDFKLSWRQSLFFALVALFNVFMIYVIFYIIETEVWAEEINGIQGRYISPYFLLFFSAFLLFSTKKLPKMRLLTGAAMLVIAGFTAASIFYDYHMPCGAFRFTSTPCTLPRYKNWDITSFESYSPSSTLKIEEVFTPRCNAVNSVGIWINDNPAGNDAPYTVSLMDSDRQVIRTVEASSQTTVKNGWMDYPFEVIPGSVNKEYTVVITSPVPAGEMTLQMAAFELNEFVDGFLQINGNSGGYAPDLVIRYGCDKNAQ